MRCTRNYTCLHDFHNEVTNRRVKRAPFFKPQKSCIRNGLTLLVAVET